MSVTVRQRRMLTVALVVLGISVAVGLGVTAFRQNLLFYFTPTQVLAGEAPQDGLIRLGGLVVEGTVQKSSNSLDVRFDLTDMKNTVTVTYDKILPDLFREGQGIIAQGRFGPDKVFKAVEVLAKHDENYMPPEVAKSLPPNAQPKAIP